VGIKEAFVNFIGSDKHEGLSFVEYAKLEADKRVVRQEAKRRHCEEKSKKGSRVTKRP
jgi:hypothetical protein